VEHGRRPSNDSRRIGAVDNNACADFAVHVQFRSQAFFYFWLQMVRLCTGINHGLLTRVPKQEPPARLIIGNTCSVQFPLADKHICFRSVRVRSVRVRSVRVRSVRVRSVRVRSVHQEVLMTPVQEEASG